MQEDLLHHIWKFRLYDQQSLYTAAGEAIEVIRPGEQNVDAGPDFFNTHLRIGGMLWVGNVEIHIRASDWIKHQHQTDQAYDNVILHVVYVNDLPIKRKNGELIPVLELKNRIDIDSYEKYRRLKESKAEIPCGKQIAELDRFVLNNWLDRMMVERLELKVKVIFELFQLNKGNWEETFYQVLARNFGFKINNEPFESLARSLPLNLIAKHKHDRSQLEALLFGQAGMLEGEFKDEYPMFLKKEYAYLKKKFSLIHLDPHLWKFSRMMPGNFPSIRISQFGSILFRSVHLFSKIVGSQTRIELEEMLEVSTAEYWSEHYLFDKNSPKKEKSLGIGSIRILIINAIIPFLFVYGKVKGEEYYISKALNLLENMEAESNKVITNWSKLGVQAQSAGHTQALLQLKREYCDKKRCLNCGVGVQLLSKKEALSK